MPVYDDEKQKNSLNAGESEYQKLISRDPKYAEDGARSAEDFANDPANVSSAASSAHSATSQSGAEGGFYNALKDRAKAKAKSNNPITNIKNRFARFSNTKKAVVGVVGGGVVATLLGVIIGFFGFLNVFRLDHWMQNIELSTFARYEADMDNRSSKWLQAYLMTRLFYDVSPGPGDSDFRPRDPDNIIFRAERVDNNNYFTDWYKTMRASRFEQDLWEKQGIKFVSNIYRDANGNRQIRPAVIRVNSTEMTFYPNADEIAAIESGDVNRLNNRLRDFVDVERFDRDENNRRSPDSQARRAIKEAVNENTKAYQVIQRYYLRKSIQNMTGVRSWRFFENSRDKIAETKIQIRNKLITKALPESTKSGKIVQCIFGIADCSSTSRDSADPATQTSVRDPNGSCSGNADARCDTGVNNDETSDNAEDTVRNNGEAETSVTEGVGGEADYDVSIHKKIVSSIVSKLNVGTGLVATVDMLNTVNNSMKSGALTNMVYMARATQYIGVFTTFAIIGDQMRSGEDVNEAEVGAVMQIVDAAGQSEAWQSVVEPSGDTTGQVSAASIQELASKAQQCSSDNQERLELPDNANAVEQLDTVFMCDSEKIGGADTAKTIQDGWNNTVGTIMAPIFAVYEKSGLSSVVSAINGAIDAVLGPIMEQTLAALGLGDDVEDIIGWLVGKTASLLGAGPIMNENTPDAKYTNAAVSGAAASAEFASRYSGAALTTPESQARAEQTVAYFRQDQNLTQSNFERYFALSNPKSLAATSLFSVSSMNAGQLVSSVFSSIAATPGRILFSTNANAATEDGYRAASFAGVETYDFPPVCMNNDPSANPVLADLTNADDLGLIRASDLTMELMEDSNNFYARLYQDNAGKGTEIQKVYNCVILDNMIKGATTATFTDQFTAKNSLSQSTPSPSTQPATPANVETSGDTVNAEGWVWPISRADHPARGLSNCYRRVTPVTPRGHTGIDIGVPVGTSVYAAKAGRVVATNPSGSGDSGKYIIIQHGDGEFSNYQHNSSIVVREGAEVQAGQLIAKSGNTGFSTGPHLHFSITTRNGLDSRSKVEYSVNPLRSLPDDGRSTGSCQ